jgi:hypothetical protein
VAAAAKDPSHPVCPHVGSVDPVAASILSPAPSTVHPTTPTDQQNPFDVSHQQLAADETESPVEIERGVDMGKRGEENGDELDYDQSYEMRRER